MKRGSKTNLSEAKKLMDERFNLNADFLAKTVEDLHLDLASKILDIGTGYGTMAIIIAMKGYCVITGEPEGDNWAPEWKVNAQKVGVDHLIEFKPLRAENLPFEPDWFDAVFLYGSLHHIEDKPATLKECARVIKPSGMIVIVEFTPKGIEIIKKRKPNHPEAINPQDYAKDLTLSCKIVKGFAVNAFIFRRK